jgi:hypothetical protein
MLLYRSGWARTAMSRQSWQSQPPRDSGGQRITGFADTPTIRVVPAVRATAAAAAQV